MSITLYYAPGSCAFAALIALEQAGIGYEKICLDMAAGEQRAPSYLTLNPMGRVPCLLVDGQPITELIAIISYVGMAHKSSGILPVEDAVSLARTMELLSWFSTNIHVHVAQIARSERFSDDPAVQAGLKAAGRDRLTAALVDLDRKIGTSEFLVGTGFTAADAVALVAWRWSEKFGLDATALQALNRKAARDLERPQVARALLAEA